MVTPVFRLPTLNSPLHESDSPPLCSHNYKLTGRTRKSCESTTEDEAPFEVTFLHKIYHVRLSKGPSGPTGVQKISTIISMVSWS